MPRSNSNRFTDDLIPQVLWLCPQLRHGHPAGRRHLHWIVPLLFLVGILVPISGQTQGDGQSILLRGARHWTSRWRLRELGLALCVRHDGQGPLPLHPALGGGTQERLPPDLTWYISYIPDRVQIRLWPRMKSGWTNPVKTQFHMSLMWNWGIADVVPRGERSYIFIHMHRSL